VDTLLSFSATLGTTYTGSWLSLSVMQITITDVYVRAADDMFAPFITADDLVPNIQQQFTFGDINETAPYMDTQVGTLTVTVKASSYLQSADLSSVHSTSKDILSGTWGDHTAPSITSIEAQEYGTVAVDVDAGDIMIINFDQPTNTPDVGTKAGVDALLTFSASIGEEYTATWTSLSTLVVTVIAGECDSTPCNSEGTTAGTLVVSTNVAGLLKSADQSSQPSRSRRTVGGSWGDVPIAPTNLTVGRVTHDGMMLSFNAPVRNNGANITHYEISYSTYGKAQPSRVYDAAPAAVNGAGAVLGSFQQYFLGNLQPGTAHASVRVRAVNYFGGGKDSQPLSVTTEQAGSFFFKHATSRVDNNAGEQTIVTIVVSRNGGAEAATLVQWKNSLAATSGKLRFGVGVIDQEFSFNVDAASTALQWDTIKLELLNPTGGAALGYPSTTHVALAESPELNKVDALTHIVEGNSLFDFRLYQEELAYQVAQNTRAEADHNY